MFGHLVPGMQHHTLRAAAAETAGILSLTTRWHHFATIRKSRLPTAIEFGPDTFGDILNRGSEAFAERARRDLMATGATVRRRTPDTLNDLRSQEAQIARLAVPGRTTPQIGTQLFMSLRTVEWQLRKVFGNLGVKSRKELADAVVTVGGP